MANIDGPCNFIMAKNHIIHTVVTPYLSMYSIIECTKDIYIFFILSVFFLFFFYLSKKVRLDVASYQVLCSLKNIENNIQDCRLVKS